MHPWEHEYQRPQLVQGSPEPLSCVRVLVKQLRKRGFIFDGAQVLDLGCGNGRNLVPFLAKGASAVGYDISPTAIQEARAQTRSPAALFAVHNIGATYPLQDTSIDLLLDITASHALLQAERQVYLRETDRVLKPGGYLFVRTLAKEGDKNARELIKQHPGPEPDTYILPELKLTERVLTNVQIRKDFASYQLISLKKTSGYAHIRGRNYKRFYWIALFQKPL